jgi:hypothetical protein
MTDPSGLVNQDTLPLVSTLSSGSWTASEAAVPTTADTNPLDAETVELLGDSCGPTGQCQAVGTFADATGGQQALLEVLSGGQWTVDSPTLPPDADGDGAFAELRSVSCQTGQPCLAVGSYLEGSGNQRSLVEDISADGSTPGDVSLPSDANDALAASLTGVACSTSIPTAVTPQTSAPSTTTPRTTTSTTTSTTTTTTPGATSTSSTSTPTTTTTTTPATTTTTPTTEPAPNSTGSSCSTVGTYQDQNALGEGIIGISAVTGSATS